jgi:dTDP-4-amino-4,6-dideoxygalactose transaminase
MYHEMFVTVPLLDLHAQYAPLREAILAAVTRVCDSQRFIGGPEVEALERELCGSLGVPYAIGLSSGTDAVLAALMALGIGPGDEVITPTYSFFATAGCVVRVGAKPVLVDVEPATFNIDVSATLDAITPRTKAIIPVHLFGQAAELAPIVDAAGQRGIAVIEDAAQAIGCSYHGRPVGTWGAVGCFSFFPSKNLGAFGDAGFVTATDPAVAKKLRLIRSHGMEPKYYHHLVGANFRIDAIQAAVLRVKLPHLQTWSDGRRANAARYRALFADAGLTEDPRGARAGNIVTLPCEAPNRSHIYNQFVIRAPERDRLKKHLDAAGIGTEIYYPVPFHLQQCFADLGYAAGAFPVAEAAARSSLALPIYPELTAAQQAAVVAAIRSFYRG